MSFDPSQPYGTVATSTGKQYYTQNGIIYDIVTLNVVTKLDEVPPNVAYPLPAKTQKSNPAMGEFAVWTVPLEQKWLVNSVTFIYQTSSALKDRQVYVIAADNNGNTLLSVTSAFVQTPLATKEYIFAPALPNSQTDLPNNNLGTITVGFPEISLGGLYTITVGAFNFDSGDQFSNCILMTEEYHQ